MATSSHLVCLFCVTAGQNGENLGSDEEQIVLFVYLLYDVTNNKVVTVQVHYVRPTPADDVSTYENVLTEECRIQTNLPEDLIKNAQPLEHVLDEFERFLCSKEVHPDHGGRPFSFCTDGQLHLRMCLLPEATRKNINLPPHFYKFFDLRKEFKKFYKTERPINCIKDMLDFLGIEGDQSVEYGVRHCQELAVIIQRLVNDGHLFTEPEIISEKLEPGVCTKEEDVDDETVVRARGLPWQSSDQDIARFFRGLNVAKGGVALCLSQQGRRNGEALVRFEGKEHRDLALRKHKHHIGQRYIEVYRATGQDFLAVAGGSSDEAHEFLSRHADNGGQVIVRMRGLPYTCTAQQVLEFFKQGLLSIDVLDGEDGILFVHQADGRATGDAFVLFGCDDDATRALTKHRQCIGNRYIELFKSTTAEVQQVLNRSVDPRAASIASDGTCGMEQQIQQHMQQQQQQMITVSQIPGHQLMATQALLQPHPFGHMTAVHLHPAGGTHGGGGMLPPGAATTATVLFPQFPQQMITCGSKRDCLRVRGLPYESTVSDILAILGDCARSIVFQGVHLVYNSMGAPSGEAFIQMDTEQSAEVAALTKSKKPYVINGRKRFVEVLQCSGDDMNVVLMTGLPDSNGNILNVNQNHRHHHPQSASMTATQLSPVSPECSPVLHQTQQNGHHQHHHLQMPAGSIFVHQTAQPAVSHIMSSGVQRPLITSMPLGASTILATPGPFGTYHPSALAVQPIIHASAAAGSLLQPVAMPPPRFSVNASAAPADALAVFPQGPHGPFATSATAPGAYQPIVYWYPSPPVSPQSSAGGNSSAGAATPTTYYIHTTASTSMPLDPFPTTVLMKGLPQNVQSNDVMAFIDGLVEVVPDVQFVRGADGRPNGDVYVTFGSRVEAERVMTQCSRKLMSNRFVEMQMI